MSGATARGGRFAAGTLVALAAGVCLAATTLPPAPARWVTDEAGVLSPGAEAAIDRKLESFEKEQGTQILVAIFHRLPADEALEDWTQRVAESWRVGRAKQDDGAVLFAFVDDRRLRIEIGYGLEGVLTDLESKTILEEALIPRLREGDWDGGVNAAVDAMIAAARGEYQPTPGASGRSQGKPLAGGDLLFLIFLVLIVFLISRRAGRGGFFRSGGWGGGGFGGGGFSGGGFGGGGFSGGGGSFGGGGASGRW